MVSLAGLYPAPVAVPTDRYRWKRYNDGSLVQVPDLRERCTTCGKVPFADQAAADRSANAATLRGTPMKSYLGPCGHYYTTRIRRK